MRRPLVLFAALSFSFLLLFLLFGLMPVSSAPLSETETATLSAAIDRPAKETGQPATVQYPASDFEPYFQEQRTAGIDVAALGKDQADPTFIQGERPLPETESYQDQIPSWARTWRPRPPEAAEQTVTPGYSRPPTADSRFDSASRSPATVNVDPLSTTHYPLPTYSNPQSPIPDLQSPVAPSAAFTITLSTVHRNSDSPGHSSTFVFTNTGMSGINFDLDFYWPNGVYVGSDGPFFLATGAAQSYDMDSASFGETTFSGYVIIGGDEPVDGRITSPDYGMISGIVVEDDGSTPLQINNLDVNRQSDGQWFGGTYNMSDGRFYIGGLPDDDYNLWAAAGYPWGSQWYDGYRYQHEADIITISGAGQAFITITMQPGGRITGTVFAEDGFTPLDNINVDTGDGGFGTCTDANGHFVLEGLSYGDHKATAGGGWNWCIGADSTYVREYYYETPNYNSATILTISSTQDLVSDIDFTLQQGGVITGTVFNENGTMPLENINVDVGTGGYGACTDADGNYTISGLPYGDYRVIAGGGWNFCLGADSDYIREYYYETPDYNSATIFSITSTNLLFTGIDFTLSTGGIITGRVTDGTNGNPLEGVRVDANEYDNNNYSSEDWSNAGGYYTITGLLDGDYRVQIFDGTTIPAGYAGQYYSHTYRWDEATPVSISGGSTATHIDFSLDPGGVITGRVVDQGTGLPLANINVDIEPWDGSWGHGSCTDDNGYYASAPVPYETYRAQAGGNWNHCLQENGVYAREYYSETIYWDEATPVQLNGDFRTDIDFTMEPGGLITGRILDGDSGLPLANINVSANAADGSNYGEGACSDDQGYFAIYALTYGDYIAQAGGDWNWCLEAPSIYIREYYSETYDYNMATILTLNSGQDTLTGINFTMEEGGSITGRVTDAATDNPLENVHVSASNYDDENFWSHAWSDTNGVYTITGLFDEDYRVRIDDPNGIPPGYAQQYWPYQFAHHLAERVNISGNSTITGINFALAPGGIITGWVIDEGSGLPLENINVNAGLYEGNGGRGECSDENGYYEIPMLIYGDYIVQGGGDWNWCLQEPSAYVREYYDNVHTYQQATPVTVNAGSTLVANINFTLESGGYIAGNIQDTNSMEAAVEGLRVAAILPGNCPWCHEWVADDYTDAAGDYRIGPLPAEAFAVYACTDCEGDEFLLVGEYYNDVYEIEDATMVTVTNGITVPDIDFLLEPGVWITGTVTVPSGYSADGIGIDAWVTGEGQYGTGRRTDPSGFYIVPVPPIYDSYWGVAPRPWAADVGDLGLPWAHQFDLAENTHWDFDLKPGATITGRITDGGSPVQGVNISAESDWANQGNQTNANGLFEITNLPTGTYRIRADGWPDRMYTYFGGHDWDWANPIDVTGGQTVTGINFEVPELGGIEGYVYESDGATPIENVRVSAMNGDGYWNGYSQVDGYFFLDAPAGDHKVRAQYDDNIWTYIPTYYDGADGVQTWGDALTVTVPPLGSGPLTITFELPKRASLSGQVTDAGSGLPVPGIHVAALNVDPLLDVEDAAWNCTDDSGNYTLQGLRPGQTLITALGTCGNYDYGTVTDTLTVSAGGTYTLDLTITQETAPPRPFTIRAEESFDYSPLSSGGSIFVSTADEILPALFSPLAQLDADGQWFSDLLTQIPTVNNGGVTFSGDQMLVTYILQPGLLWSDGAPLTSADIRFAWQMMVQPQPNFDSYRAYVGAAWKIESIETPDSLTAVLKYNRGQYPADYLGAIPYPLPVHILGEEHYLDVRWISEYAHKPFGNGPYVVVDWVPGSHLDLRPNPNYHKRGLGLPVIEDVRYLFNGHPFYSLLDGTADVSLNLGDQVPADYQIFDVDVFTTASTGFSAIIPDKRLPFFAEAEVRRALFHALDRGSWLDNYPPTSSQADSWLPPDHPLYTEVITKYDFNLATAAALLDAAGWIDSNSNGIRDKDGVEFEFDLVYNEGNDVRQSLSLIFQSDLSSIGIDANVIAVPWQDFLEGARRGEWDAFSLGWGFDSRYDPNGYGLWHSLNIPTAYRSYRGSSYIGFWSDATNDAMLEATLSELDGDELRSLYGQQIANFSDQVPVWTTNTGLRNDAASPILLNFHPNQSTPATWNIEEWEMPANPYDVAVRKSLALNSPSPQPNTTIIYEVNVRNAGYFTVDNVVLVDTLPPQVDFIGATPPPDNITGRTLTWNTGDLPGYSSEIPFLISVHIPVTVAHGTVLTNSVQVYGDQDDTQPDNNGFLHQVTVRDDVDLSVEKSGIGQPAVGEQFTYIVDYANWGGAPAFGAVITDVLPAEVSLLDAVPTPSGMAGQTLTWTLPTLEGNQWAGQIQILAEIDNTGTITNVAEIGNGAAESDYTNNEDNHVEFVDEILPPLILRPTQGTTDGTPTIKGQAPSNSVVDIWDLTTEALASWVISTTASPSGTFEVELNLAEGSYILVATDSKAGLNSGYSNAASIVVDHDVPLDPDFVSISAGNVDLSLGSIRTEQRMLPHRTLQVEAVLGCLDAPVANLAVTENGLYNYNIPTLTTTDLGGDQWLVEFLLYLADPHSSYEIWIEWQCQGSTSAPSGFWRDLLSFILIDPDGFVYDKNLVNAGSTITDSLILDALVTAYVKFGDNWVLWPANLYNQYNPQVTDGSTADGVLEPGYYSFLTPSGQYRINAQAPGYRPYESPILTVITSPVHLDIGLLPIVGGTGSNQQPVKLSGSTMAVDKAFAWLGEELNYEIQLENSGGTDTGMLSLVDAIPDNTSYVIGSISWNSGVAVYNPSNNTIWWNGVVKAKQTVHINFSVIVDATPGTPFDVANIATVTGPPADLVTMPPLMAFTNIQNVIGLELEGDE